jgi:flagellar assembly factor FliW
MGDVEVSEGDVLHFEDGIPGFAGSTRFALLNVSEDSAFQLLQSLDEPDVAMIVTVPWLFFPDYAPELSELERQELELDAKEDAVIFSAVTLDADHGAVYLNLLGPFVVNVRTHRGRQVVLADSGYPVRAEARLVDA